MPQSHLSQISDLFNKVIIHVNTDPAYQIHASLPNMNESCFLCVTVSSSPGTCREVIWTGGVLVGAAGRGVMALWDCD